MFAPSTSALVVSNLWAKNQSIDPSAHHSPNSHTVGVFWALLLLSAQSKVELVQEEFYQDVKIRLIAHSQENHSKLPAELAVVNLNAMGKAV